MTREKVIQIGNDLINNRGDISLWMELIKDFVDYKDSSKTDIILKAFPQIPQHIQIEMVKIALDHFSKEFEVFILNAVETTATLIINGIPQTQFKPIKYY